MFDTDLAPREPADEAPDPAVARAERRLRLLEELTELGMKLARALDPDAPANKASDASAGPAAQPNDRDPADAFGRISRAIRLTLGLEAKTDTYLRDLKAGVVLRRQAEKAEATEKARFDRTTRVERVRELVRSAAEAEIPDFESFSDLDDALEQRLVEDDAYMNCDQWPLRETVERLCHDLMLNPDWSRWTGEGWSEPDDGPSVRSRYSHFNQPSRTPLDVDEPAPPDIPAPVQPWQYNRTLE